MNGPIAQMVALTCYGNAFLSGQKVDRFFPQNSTFNFCDRVSFVVIEKTSSGKLREMEVASNPDEWFDLLKSSGARGIHLSLELGNDPKMSDRMSAAFVGGGGTWSMETLFTDNRSEYWISRWEVWAKDAPEQRIWRIIYGRVSTGATMRCTPPDLTNITTRLKYALSEIHAFSKKHDCGGFKQCFADALDSLSSTGKNLHGYHKDLAPSGFLSNEVVAILDACQRAWVFGGMGSWNDMMFDKDEQNEYERVSEQLFQTINEAIVAGANSTYKVLI